MQDGNSTEKSELPWEVSAHETKELLDQNADFVLIDCREPAEHAICHISNALLIPMADIPHRCNEIETHRDKRIVVYCHLGSRSLQVVNWLRNHGFSGAQNMTGGIEAWSVSIDPNVPRY